MKQVFVFVFFVLTATNDVNAQVYDVEHLLNPSSAGAGPAGYDAKAAVEQIIAQSKCTAVDSGKAKEPSEALPQGFRQGVVRSFVRSLCRSHDVPTPPWMGPRQMMGRTPMSANDGHDALDMKKYQTIMGRMKPSSETGPAVDDMNITKTYTLLLSLGMAESAGITSTKADGRGDHAGGVSTLEAGLFQTSANSDVSNSPQNQIIVQYGRLFRQANGDPAALEKICLNKEFNPNPKLFLKPGYDDSSKELSSIIFDIPDSPAKVPKAEDFRTLMLSCPAAATEYSAVLARDLADHNGPLKRGDISPSPECFDMMTSITQKYEADSAHFCSSFQDPVDDEKPATNNAS